MANLCLGEGMGVLKSFGWMIQHNFFSYSINIQSIFNQIFRLRLIYFKQPHGIDRIVHGLVYVPQV